MCLQLQSAAKLKNSKAMKNFCVKWYTEINTTIFELKNQGGT